MILDPPTLSRAWGCVGWVVAPLAACELDSVGSSDPTMWRGEEPTYLLGRMLEGMDEQRRDGMG